MSNENEEHHPKLEEREDIIQHIRYLERQYSNSEKAKALKRARHNIQDEKHYNEAWQR